MKKKRRMTRLDAFEIIKRYERSRPKSTKEHKRLDRARRRVRGYGDYRILHEHAHREFMLRRCFAR